MVKSMFADDTALFFTGNDSVEIERNLNADLKLISQWLENNGLVINPTKTEFMLIGTHQKLRRFQPLRALPEQKTSWRYPGSIATSPGPLTSISCIAKHLPELEY